MSSLVAEGLGLKPRPAGGRSSARRARLIQCRPTHNAYETGRYNSKDFDNYLKEMKAKDARNRLRLNPTQDLRRMEKLGQVVEM